MELRQGADTQYLFVCCPCYNEEMIELEKTIRSLLKNFEFIKTRVRFSDDEFGQELKKKFAALTLVFVPIFDGMRAMSASCKRWIDGSIK